MIPPFRTPGNASWCFSDVQSATTSSPETKLRMRSPFSFAGPQPKHAFLGAYVSWRLRPSMGSYFATAVGDTEAAVEFIDPDQSVARRLGRSIGENGRSGGRGGSRRRGRVGRARQ